MFAGLLRAGHGAQKTFAAWGAPGLHGHGQQVRTMGFRLAGFWEDTSAWGELLGGWPSPQGS